MKNDGEPMAMRRDYYSSSIEQFLKTDEEIILGKLLINDEFETTDLQKNSWQKEISILKVQLLPFGQGDISFEFTIPRIGHRIDVVCIIDGVIFLLEFKVGESEFKKAANSMALPTRWRRCSPAVTLRRTDISLEASAKSSPQKDII